MAATEGKTVQALLDIQAVALTLNAASKLNKTIPKAELKNLAQKLIEAETHVSLTFARLAAVLEDGKHE